MNTNEMERQQQMEDYQEILPLYESGRFRAIYNSEGEPVNKEFASQADKTSIYLLNKYPDWPVKKVAEESLKRVMQFNKIAEHATGPGMKPHAVTVDVREATARKRKHGGNVSAIVRQHTSYGRDLGARRNDDDEDDGVREYMDQRMRDSLKNKFA